MKHKTATSCDRGKHSFGREAFCGVCGAPNPRCIECGRRVKPTANGASVRCVKGHSHSLRRDVPVHDVGSIPELRCEPIVKDRRYRGR